MEGGKMLMTVCGATACEADSVAWVLPHEHIVHNIRSGILRRNGTIEKPVGSTVTDIRPDQLHELRVDPTAFDGISLVMDREDETFRELEVLVKMSSARGVCVDVTTKTEGRDMARLKRLSERAGVHIVASTSFEPATILSWPSSISLAEKAERAAKFLETELLFGVGETQSEGCAGVIYQQIHLAETIQADDDELIARALATAQANTGAPVFLSFSSNQASSPPREVVTPWVSKLMDLGAAPDRLVLCHADLWCEELGGVQWLEYLARQGVQLSFDLIGMYTVADSIAVNPCLAPVNKHVEPPRDSSIARCIAHLISGGFAGNVLVSSGVQQRIQFQKYGGGGYSYVMQHFKQRLIQHHGVAASVWDQIVRENPLRLLQWYSPPEAAPIPKHFIKCSICEQYFEPIVGEYFTKFQFTYCGTKCLRKHSKMGFKPLDS